MATPRKRRHVCVRCFDSVEIEGEALTLPEGWKLMTLRGKPVAVCADCVAALDRFRADMAIVEQSR